MNNIPRLYYVTQDHPFKSHQELAYAACKGGAEWIQLRVKNRSEADVKDIAIETLKICKSFNVKLIINDYVSLAKEIAADGIHLGKEDMDPLAARALLGENFIIGGTANTWEDVQKLSRLKVHYIGLGPFRHTATKEKLSPVLGLEGFARIMRLCSDIGITIPIVAIGGIQPEDAEDILKTGIYGVAVAGAIGFHPYPEKAVCDFRERLDTITIH